MLSGTYPGRWKNSSPPRGLWIVSPVIQCESHNSRVTEWVINLVLLQYTPYLIIFLAFFLYLLGIVLKKADPHVPPGDLLLIPCSCENHGLGFARRKRTIMCLGLASLAGAGPTRWIMPISYQSSASMSSASINRVLKRPSKSQPSIPSLIPEIRIFWRQENPSSAVTFSRNCWFCFTKFFMIGLALASLSSSLEILSSASVILLPRVLTVSFKDSTRFSPPSCL